jgi:hypothetical protein
MAKSTVGLEPRPEYIAMKLAYDYTFDDIQLGYILRGTYERRPVLTSSFCIPHTHLLRQHIIFTSVLSDLSYYSTNDIQTPQK